MTDSYRSANIEIHRHVETARRLRSAAFHRTLGSVATALRAGFQQLRCWQVRQRAEFELRNLSSAILKDIGVSRSEIGSRVREALPCD